MTNNTPDYQPQEGIPQPPTNPAQPAQPFAAPMPPSYAAPSYAAPAQPAQPYYAPPMSPPYPAAAPSKGLPIAGVILGIIGIPAAFFAILGYVCGILALVFGIRSLRKPGVHGLALTSTVLGVVVLVLSVISSIIGVVLRTQLSY